MALVSLRRGGGTDMPAYDGPMLGGPMSDHHPGLCIALNDEILQKLDVDDEADVGDLLHLRVIIEVTSVHKSGDGCRIEAAIIGGEVENESEEGEDEEEEEEDE